MEKLTEVLAELASKFGTTVEHLWGVMVTQAEIQLQLYYITFAVTVVFLIPYILYCIWCVTKWDDFYNNETETVHAITLFFWGGTVFGLIIASACAIKPVVTILNNPEYWALYQIIG